MLSLFVTAALVLGLAVTMAFASENDAHTVYIANSSDLVQAIQNQEDGQTWVFTQAGTYDAKNTTEGSNGTYAAPADVYAYPFALPLWADNLTITKADGVGDVTLTSSYVAPNGNWHEQNFITVYGTGVTIDGINLQANRSDYYGTCNKVIEVCGQAKDFTLRNVNIIPLKDEDGTSFGGSIYFSVSDAGASKHEECTACGYAKAAVTIPATGEQPSQQPSAQPSQKPDGVQPDTGDSVNLTIWVALMVVCLGTLTSVSVYTKKRG